MNTLFGWIRVIEKLAHLDIKIKVGHNDIKIVYQFSMFNDGFDQVLIISVTIEEKIHPVINLET